MRTREIFNRPWMDQIDPGLLYRYWINKGCPGILHTTEFGVRISTVETPFGVLRIVGKNLKEVRV